MPTMARIVIDTLGYIILGSSYNYYHTNEPISLVNTVHDKEKATPSLLRWWSFALIPADIAIP